MSSQHALTSKVLDFVYEIFSKGQNPLDKFPHRQVVTDCTDLNCCGLVRHYPQRSIVLRYRFLFFNRVYPFMFYNTYNHIDYKLITLYCNTSCGLSTIT